MRDSESSGLGPLPSPLALLARSDGQLTCQATCMWGLWPVWRGEEQVLGSADPGAAWSASSRSAGHTLRVSDGVTHTHGRKIALSASGLRSTPQYRGMGDSGGTVEHAPGHSQVRKA